MVDPLRILVMEADPQLNEMLVRPLEVLGAHPVLSALDGAAALALLQQQPVEVVLTDWKMPALDGLELTAHIHLLSSP